MSKGAAAVLSASRRLAILRARIFGDVVRSTSDSDKRVMLLLSQRPWQRQLPDWYPPNHSTLLLRLERLGLYHNEHNSFLRQMATQRKDRGKGPPQKGEGRQKKSKKKK